MKVIFTKNAWDSQAVKSEVEVRGEEFIAGVNAAPRTRSCIASDDEPQPDFNSDAAVITKPFRSESHAIAEA